MSANVKRKHPVRASKLQLQTLQAAFVPDQNLSAEAVKRLSDDTGLTCEWIRSWFGRFRKRERDARGTKREAISEPENDPPAQKKKRGRVARVPKLEESTLELPPGPISDNLPPADDSYIPPRSKNFNAPSIPPLAQPTTSFSSTSAQNNSRPSLVSYAAPGSHAYYYGSGVPGSNFSSFQLRPPPHQQQSSASHSQQSAYPSFGPLLLPPPLWQSPQNVDPALQRIPEQAPANVTSRTPASSNPTAYNRTAPLLVPSVGGAPAFYVNPAASPFASTVARPSLFSGNQLPPPHATASIEPSPFCPSNKNTPVPGLQPPFDPSYSNDSFKHTLVTPSHLHSYIPNLEDNNENDDPQSAGAAISNDDHLLFSSMLNLTPGSPVKRTAAASVPAGEDKVFDVEKAPLKYLSVLQGDDGAVCADMTLDEMYERLLDDDLATSDPFQAAMGLVFMSRTGLDWEDC
ncbi:hypothetical protein B0H14DRAFT_2838952 [Mycena olivaceomarginata]|nr:hypothetical protein B0H14DRAFT_2838952 [Mycena olivaceomarginata]